MTPELHWEGRHETYKRVKRSEGFWMSLDEEARETLIEMVRGAIAVMYDNVEEWLPDAFTGETHGEAIKVELMLLMGDVDTEMARRIESSSMRRKEAAAALRESLKELHEE